MSDFENNTGVAPGPWPWYVLLLVGHCLCGLFPWLMVLWGVFRRGQKRTAIIGLTVNFLIYGILSVLAIRSRAPWWWLSLFFYVINPVWALSAWILQKKVIGTAEARYLWSERSTWVFPLLLGVFIGMSLYLVLGIPEALIKRSETYAAMAGGRESVLWDVLKSGAGGIPFGLLLGVWWAGERGRFSASHIVTFLAACCISAFFIAGCSLFLILLFTERVSWENLLSGSSGLILNPPWVPGLPRVLTSIETHDILIWLIIPLLFGAVSRLRDFAKRMLLLPAVLLITFPGMFLSNVWWEVLQGRAVHDMSSPEERTRAAAYERAAVLLARYPQHLQWASLAERLARYRYECGRYDDARVLYQSTIQRFKGSKQWRWEVDRAEAALGSPSFGDPGSAIRIDIPMVGYENYLTANWMALLSIIRYWEGPQSSESDTKIKLRTISKADDKIQLNPLLTIAELDDAVGSLNLQMAILPTNLEDLKALISAGIPVILVDRYWFQVVYGYDSGRSALLYYGYNRLTAQTRGEGRGEAEEILALKAEGQGESRKRLERIRREAAGEYGLGAERDRFFRYRAPYMVAIYPSAKAQDVAGILELPLDSIMESTRGYLSAFISLEFLRHADPVRALEWAMISSRLITTSLPLQVGDLAHRYWQSREKKVATRLPFQDQFTELKEIERKFGAPENSSFLHKARQQFDSDFKTGDMPFFLLDALRICLSSNDPEDRDQLIQAGRLRVAADPADTDGWRILAVAYEHAPDQAGLIGALEGLTASNPLDFDAKVDLARALVLNGDIGKAASALNETEVEKVESKSDFLFCRGAVAEWEKQPRKAMKYYRQAIEASRYKPVYHLYYGRLLLAEGMKEEGAKALRWASRIDAEGSVKKQAEQLLAEIAGLN